MLCHKHISVDRTLRTARVFGLAVATRAQRQPGAEDYHGIAQFTSPDGAMFRSDDAVTIAAFDYLAGCAPQAVAFASLCEVVREQLGVTELADEDRSRLAANLLK